MSLVIMDPSPGAFVLFHNKTNSKKVPYVLFPVLLVAPSLLCVCVWRCSEGGPVPLLLQNEGPGRNTPSSSGPPPGQEGTRVSGASFVAFPVC